MKKIITALTVTLYLTAIHLSAQVSKSGSEENKGLIADLLTTMGLCTEVSYTLDHLGVLYPDLKNDADAAQLQWNSAFVPAQDYIEELLDKAVNGKWKTIRKKALEEQTPQLLEKAQKYTHEDAVTYINMAKQAARSGRLFSPSREILLAFHPDYRKNPRLEFDSGYTDTFSTKGHAKADGVNITFKTPLSWKRSETDNNAIIQQWNSEGGYGDHLFIIYTLNTPSTPTPEELEVIFSKEFAVELISHGMTIYSYETEKISGFTLAKALFSGVKQADKITTQTHSTNYYFLKDDSVMVFTFYTTTTGSKEESQAKVQKHLPLFEAVINSVVLNPSS